MNIKGHLDYIAEEWRGQGRKVGSLNLVAEFFCLRDSLFLCSSVLEPDLDLGVRQLELLGKVCSLGDGEVSLGLVFLLQSVQLLGGEGSSGFAISSVLPQDWPGSWQHWRRLVMLLKGSQKKERLLLGEERRIRR